MNFRREIKFFPAYDKRHVEDGKNYGIHGCDISFAVIGEDAAIRLMVFSNWHLPHVRAELEARPIGQFPFYHPESAGLSFHAKSRSVKAELAGQYTTHKCDLLNDEECNSDISFTGLSEEWYQLIAEKGSDGLFEKLEEIYVKQFGE